MLSSARAHALRPLLDALDAGLDRAARIAADPVEFPRACADPADAEVAGLVAVSLAYGRADLFKPVVARVLAAMGPSPARFAEAFAAAPDRAAFAGFLYRFNRPADVAALVAALGHVRRAHGGLGARFRALSYAEIGSAAMLSRAVGGVWQGRAVFSVPGSTAAVRLAWEKLIGPELGHVVRELRKDGRR